MAKCTFGVRTGKLLEFIVNERGIELDPDKVKAIWNMPAPKSEKELSGLLGRINYIAPTCSPMFKLLWKNQKMEWNKECQEAFEKIKEYLESPPVLVLAIPIRPLILYLTVLKESMGGILGQLEVSGIRANLFCSGLGHKKTPAIHVGSYYMAYCQNRPLKYIFEKPALIGSALAEQLAHHPLDEYHPLSHKFPDEHILMAEENKSEVKVEGWKLWFDGASNLLGNGIGAVLASSLGQYFPFSARLGFDYTNNMVEYEACAMGITMAIEHQIGKLRVFDDSTLVFYQLREEWETQDAKLIPYHAHITVLAEQFEEISFHYVLQDENQMADALETLSAMLQENQDKEMTIQVRQQSWMAHCQQIEEVEIDGKPWYHDIKEYLKKGDSPYG
ncbi:Retrovirus-related Pol polyprotein, partial [Mucuna pruriens]